MINLLLDILIYKYTSFKSFFFLQNINFKSLLLNISISLYIDIFILHTYFISTIYIIGIYFIHKYIKINYYNIVNYYLFNISIIYIYYFILSIIYNYHNILFNMFISNSIYILISYIKESRNIKLYW